MSDDEKFVYTACPGWGDHEYCAIKTIVKDGKILRTEHAEYTGCDANQGFICQKGITSGRHPYLPGRLLHPLKRIGERGEGKWQEISWDQAMDEIGEKLVKIRDEYGPQSLAMWGLTASVPPSLGLACLLSARFSSVFGATDPLQSYGLDTGPCFAGLMDLGNAFAYMYFDPNLIAKSKYVVIWGANPVENQQRITRYLVEAHERGAKIVDIGLLFDATAGMADWFIPVKPGSDTALALSMAHVIVAENLYDRDFLTKYTVAPFLVNLDNGLFLRDSDGNYLIWDSENETHVSVPPNTAEMGVASAALLGEYNIAGYQCKPAFQLLSEHLGPYTPEAQESVTGVSAEAANRLAHEYANAKPALLLGALGMRYQNQGESYRALYLLGSLTGNIGVPGGGVTSQLLPSNHHIVFNDYPIVCPDGIQNIKTHFVRQADFYEQVASGDPYPIKAFIKIAGNPIHNCPNRSRWVEEVFPKMDLIVDYDIWMTDTGEYADYVLPDCTPFERTEIISAAAYNHIVLQEPAIEPLGEAKDPAYFFKELSKRVGVGQYFDKTAEDWVAIRIQSTFPMVANIQPPLTMERLKKEKRIRAAVPETPYDPCASRKFPTASGRIEFYQEKLADLGEAIAIYRPPLEIGNENKIKQYPYQFFSGRQRFFMQSMFTDDPWMVKLSGDEPTARMNPVDAEKEGIKDFDLIECFNERGKVKVPVRLDHSIPPGTVQVWFGWRKRHFKEGMYSELLVPLGSRETLDDLADRWWSIVNQTGRVGSVFLGFESALSGAWDTIWDCVCDVRKVEG